MDETPQTPDDAARDSAGRPVDPWAEPTGGSAWSSPTEPTQPLPPARPMPSTPPAQPYGDPYASASAYAGYAGPPAGQTPDPWLPPVAPLAVGPSEPARTSRRFSGLTLVAVALAAGLISAAGVSAVVIATRPGSSTPASTSFGTSAAPSGTAPAVERSRPAGSIAAVAADVLPSVVSIIETSPSGSGEGSGVILDTAGDILTNNHVVAEAASGGTLTVTFHDGSSAKATIVGRDPLTDIAVVRVSDKQGLQPARLGDSSSLQVGDQVIAIGSPLGLSGTVTEGIVSALDRPVVTDQTTDAEQAFIPAIQTDAAINPGNSGGALVDAEGAVVGINSAIATVSQNSFGGQSGNIGVGFAIPIDQAKRVAAQIIAGQTATHARLGTTVAANDANPTTIGARLDSIASGSAAAKAGLKVGDVITKVNDSLVQGADGLIATIRSFAPGTTVQITFVRDGQTHTVSVTLGSDAS